MAEASNTQDLIAEAQALIDTAQAHLAAGEEFFRSQGLDPAKVQEVVSAQLDRKGIEAAQKAFEEDMAAVEQEAHEEMARRSFASKPAAGGVRRPRMMV
jgi:beta-phosphoglucomutase-like phosphatase (HAD superfamily)